MMKKILILGGTGFVGTHVCEKLVKNLYRVTVATRRKNNAQHLQLLPTLEVAQVNVHDPAALTALVAGHDAVINLVAILHGSEAAFDRAHEQLPQKLVQACLNSGVRRIIHVSALGVSFNSASRYQRSKARGEAVLQNSGLDVTLLRPSVIFGAQDKFLNTFAKLQALFPVIPLAASHARFQPVWVEDVASAALCCLNDARTIGQIFEACGPSVFTLKELVQWAGRYAGVRGGRGRLILALPEPLARLQAGLMELLPGDPVLSRDNLDAMKTDNIASGQLPGLTALGICPAALAAIAPSYLGTRNLHSGLLAKRQTAGR